MLKCMSEVEEQLGRGRTRLVSWFAKIAKTLARHSNITLTLDRYTHVGLHDLTASVNSLPSVPANATNPEMNVLKATGTEDAAGSEVPTVVPRGADIGAVLPAPHRLQIAPVCTEGTGDARRP